MWTRIVACLGTKLYIHIGYSQTDKKHMFFWTAVHSILYLRRTNNSVGFWSDWLTFLCTAVHYKGDSLLGQQAISAQHVASVFCSIFSPLYYFFFTIGSTLALVPFWDGLKRPWSYRPVCVGPRVHLLHIAIFAPMVKTLDYRCKKNPRFSRLLPLFSPCAPPPLRNLAHPLLSIILHRAVHHLFSRQQEVP
jgi:hypothetical protein